MFGVSAARLGAGVVVLVLIALGGGGCSNPSEASVDGCAPTTCTVEGAQCDTIPDGCGGMLDCGACIAPDTCGGGGTPNACSCTPEDDETFCSRLGKDCDTFSGFDNCGAGRTANCGACALPETCGGTGTENVCGCSSTTCAAEAKDCGNIVDGCAGTLSCGTCDSPEICGGGGAPNVCGDEPCTPTTCVAQGAECGAISDGCATTLSCGTCHADGTCTAANQCVCDPGFEGDGLQCVDINECALGIAGCDGNAGCTNTQGGFTCTCNDGV